MEGTRLRILQLLQKNGADTVDGLANAINLAPATIRRHLDILQRDGLVAFEQVRKKTGRPEYSFHLTEAGQGALPKNYDQLLGLMIGELAAVTRQDTHARDGSEILELVFTRLAENVSKGYEGQVAGQPLDARLDVLRSHLENEDFSPDVEFVGDSLRIRLLNCPFRAVALQSKAVCTFDYGLISTMLGTEVEREECIHDGDTACMYTAVVAARPSSVTASPA